MQETTELGKGGSEMIEALWSEILDPLFASSKVVSKLDVAEFLFNGILGIIDLLLVEFLLVVALLLVELVILDVIFLDFSILAKSSNRFFKMYLEVIPSALNASDAACLFYNKSQNNFHLITWQRGLYHQASKPSYI